MVYSDENLFDVSGVEQVPSVRTFTIGPCTTADVREFMLRYHYLGRRGSPVSYNYGLWHGLTLYGVICYDRPSREATSIVFGEDHCEHVYGMGRLALADIAPPNSESRLIGGSLRLLQRDRPDAWAVLTYAARDAGHVGYVYQATNALYTGEAGEAFYYLDPDGNRRSSRTRSTGNDARSEGWTRVKGLPKHRYLYLLGSRTERRHRTALLRLPSLPYPKD